MFPYFQLSNILKVSTPDISSPHETDDFETKPTHVHVHTYTSTISIYRRLCMLNIYPITIHNHTCICIHLSIYTHT